MKKRIIGAVAIGAVLVLPKVVSSQVAQSLESFVQSLDAQPAYNASVVSIDSGWFSTSAKIQVSVDMASIDNSAANIDENITQVLDFSAQHGPIIFGHSFGLGWSNWQVSTTSRPFSEFLTWQDDQPFYSLEGGTGIFGGSHYTDKVTAFEYQDKVENVTGKFSGFEGKGEFDSSEFAYRGAFNSFTVNDGDMDAEIDKLEINASINGNWLEMLNNIAVESDMGVDIHSIRLGNSDEELFNAQRIDLSVSNDLNDDKSMADLIQKFKVTSLTVEGYPLKDVHFNMSFNNLDVGFLKAYQDQMQAISGAAPELVVAQMQEFGKTHLITFLKAQPGLNVDKVSATLPEGDLLITSKNSIVNVETLPNQLNDPGFWIGHASSETHIDTNKAVAMLMAKNYVISQLQNNPQTAGMEAAQLEQIAMQQAPVMIDTFIAQGLFVAEGDALKSEILLKDKQLTINGTAIPLPY